MTRYAMVIDMGRCIGCKACVIACKNRNGTGPGVSWARIETTVAGSYPDLQIAHRPIQCMHCAEPPCTKVCPTGASHQQEDGIVVVDYRKCKGCRACIKACPYGARSPSNIQSYYQLDEHPKKLAVWEQMGYATHRAHVVEGCDFCRAGLSLGYPPACVSGCIYGARTFGDLDDRDSEVARLIRRRHGVQFRPEAGTDPSIFYIR